MIEDEQQPHSSSSYNRSSENRRESPPRQSSFRRRDLMDPFSDFFDDDPFFSRPFGGFDDFGFGSIRRSFQRMQRMMEDFDFDSPDNNGTVFYSSTTTTTSVNGVISENYEEFTH